MNSFVFIDCWFISGSKDNEPHTLKAHSKLLKNEFVIKTNNADEIFEIQTFVIETGSRIFYCLRRYFS